MVSMQRRDSSWSPMKALGSASRYVDSLMVPTLGVNLEDREHLEFSDLMNSTNKELEEFLVVYGGYKAYLESQISDAQAKKNALIAAFEEGYATADSRVADEREEAGKKKLTREEVRGAVMDKYDSLKELKREIIEQEAVETRITGLLNTYTTAYNTVSRVVTIRMDNTHRGM